MNSDIFVEYAIAAAPLLAAHFVVPPLSYFLGEHWNALPPQFDEYYKQISFARVRELMLDPTASSNESDPVCWITYMFVHGDYDHLINNLQSLISVGLPVYRHLGSFGLYTVFIAGGIAAPYPSPLRDTQSKRDYNAVNHFLGKLTGIKMKICGSSGAIFALFAAGNVLTLFDILGRTMRGLEAVAQAHEVDHMRTISNRKPSWVTILRRDLRLMQEHVHFERILPSLLNFAYSLSLVRREWMLAADGKHKYIDNAGHFQGFLAGAAIAAILSMNQYLSSTGTTPHRRRIN